MYSACQQLKRFAKLGNSFAAFSKVIFIRFLSPTPSQENKLVRGFGNWAATWWSNSGSNICYTFDVEKKNLFALSEKPISAYLHGLFLCCLAKISDAVRRSTIYRPREERLMQSTANQVARAKREGQSVGDSAVMTSERHHQRSQCTGTNGIRPRELNCGGKGRTAPSGSSASWPYCLIPFLTYCRRILLRGSGSIRPDLLPLCNDKTLSSEKMKTIPASTLLCFLFLCFPLSDEEGSFEAKQTSSKPGLCRSWQVHLSRLVSRGVRF